LVVDDEPLILKLTYQALVKLGYSQVETADSVQTAAHLLMSSELPPSLIIIDLDMPGEDGLDLLTHLERIRYKGNIIFHSGVSPQAIKTAEVVARSRHLSAIGSLSKPLQPQKLKALIERGDAVLPVVAPVKISSTVTKAMLASAITNGDIRPWFQPKVCLKTLNVVGFEALARWTNAEGGSVPPDAFIPVAEDAGLIDPLTFSLIRQVANQCHLWTEAGFRTSVSVNVSMSSLRRPDFYERLRDEASNTELVYDQLQIEVTESQLTDDSLIPLETLIRLNMLKVALLIDDFGTGHSTLKQLRNLPFDGLKLDKTFIHASRDSERAEVILKASIQMARELDMYTVAEGIETCADWNRACKLGVDYVQGYLVARPMPGEDVKHWIRTWPTARKSFSARR
jgi:EAL domain-containing protein (putative c-di-GMP-specific phosphodiesterase class I)/FixJ family two-component response regulator